MVKITPPGYSNGWLDNYIREVPYTDLCAGLKEEIAKSSSFIQSLSEEKLNYRYAEGKWSIKEIIVHVTDTERIFAYRAMRFARKDKTPLPGFDEKQYTLTAKASHRNIQTLLSDWSDVRRATISLFQSFDEEMLDEKGNANNTEMSPRGLGYGILGHEIHHLKVIRERYF